MIFSAHPFQLDMRAADNSPRVAKRPGVHLSDLVRRLESHLPQNVGKRKPFDQLTPDELHQMAVRVEMGFIWERMVMAGLDGEESWAKAVTSHFRNRQLTARKIAKLAQRSWSKDGIVGTPDLVLVEEWEPEPEIGLVAVVEEYKATWKSMKKETDFFTAFWGWHVQTRGYCWMVGATRVRFRVLWVNGEYKGWGGGGSEGPCAREYRITYSQRELGENWRMLVMEKDRLLAEQAANQAPKEGSGE